MPSFTIDLIRENPWNVVTHTLPSCPTRVLYELGIVAATYCRDSENLLMWAARNGDYIPTGWEPGGEFPDTHEASEGLSFQSDERLFDIVSRYERYFQVDRRSYFWKRFVSG